MTALRLNRLLNDRTKVKVVLKQNVHRSNKHLYDDDHKSRTKRAETLELANNYWNGMQQLRDKVERNWRYFKGKQWDDLVYSAEHGGMVREKDLIQEQGQVPLVINMIAPAVNNLIGQFISSKSRNSVVARSHEDAPVGEMLTNTLWSIQDINEMWKKDSSALLMFLCSGLAIQRLDYGYFHERKRKDVRFKNMELPTVFFNPIIDQDNEDLTMIGRFYDVPIGKILNEFAYCTEDEVKIKQMYAYTSPQNAQSDYHFSETQLNNVNFFFPDDSRLCRVFEVWEKRGGWFYEWFDPYSGKFGDDVEVSSKSKAYFENENAKRIEFALNNGVDAENVRLIQFKEKYVEFWHYQYMTPNYELLAEGKSPFENRSNPFVIHAHSLVRGEILSFLDPIIDINRLINRNMVLLDYITGSSAKGVLYIDEKYLSEDMDIDEAVFEYTKRNGVIKLNLPKGMKPSDVLGQITSNAIPAGVNESLALGQKLMQQISGVNDAVQGRSAGASVPASRYAQEAQNSTLNTLYIMDSFNRTFRTKRDRKALELALQFYEDKRYLPVSGNKNSSAQEFDRSKIKDDLEYDMSIGAGMDSQIYRAITDDWIKEFITNGLIPLEVGLKHVSFPGVDTLLNDLDEFKKNVQQQQQGGGNGMEAMQQGLPNVVNGYNQMLQQQGANAQNADPRAMDMIERYYGMKNAG